MKFFTQWDRPERQPEINDGPSMVETAGYIPAKQRIENILDAGERLAMSRAEQYDFQPGEPTNEAYLDPTRNPNYDLADASRDKEILLQRLKEAAEDVIQDKIDLQEARQEKKATTEQTEKEKPTDT